MKVLIATIGLGAAFVAAGAAPAGLEPRHEPAATLEAVDSIPALTRPHGWTVLDDETLIIWAAPRKPYLVRLFRPSPELKFAHAIGVTSFGSRIHARFDSVEVDGFSYPIREIYRMSRDDANAMRARS